ncbi:MAG: AAA family ATPase [Planctomycetes bacterium]|nr:AAA family ATPase [Planctomycetota bacterium]
MRCIAVINQKGGCGKTTVSINLSSCLAVQGQRTLLVDMDPQSHCAVGLAVPEEQIERNIYDVLISAHGVAKTELKSIVWQISQNFDLAPAGIELAALEPQLSGLEKREECLKQMLGESAQGYDFVVIDCPPSVSLLTFNALRAADEVIIPVETGYFALHGLGRQLETLEVLKQQCQQQISIRMLPTMYDVRTKLAREVFSEMKKHHSGIMFESMINFNTKLKEAASFGQPISEYDPASRGMRDFMALGTELINSKGTVTTAKMIEEVELQLQTISKSADELLAESKKLVGEQPVFPREQSLREMKPSEPAIIEPELVEAEVHKQVDIIQEKIDKFYGIRQNQGRVEFAALYPQASTVQIAGDFNNWQPEVTSLEREDGNGRWSINLPLNSGEYRYRYVVDGRWQSDPYNDRAEVNPFGEYNSVLEVK